MTSVNDRAGAEEQERFEEAVRDQVHDAGSNTTDAEGDHHQSQLRDGGIGENAFDVELRERDERRHQGGDHAGPHDHGQRRRDAINRTEGEERINARNQKYASSYHGGGMDQCAHWRRAFHGIR